MSQKLPIFPTVHGSLIAYLVDLYIVYLTLPHFYTDTAIQQQQQNTHFPTHFQELQRVIYHEQQDAIGYFTLNTCITYITIGCHMNDALQM